MQNIRINELIDPPKEKTCDLGWEKENQEIKVLVVLR